MEKVFSGMHVVLVCIIVSALTKNCYSQVFNHCPDWFLILPCTCYHDGSQNAGLWDCSNVMSEQQLRDIFHNTDDFPSKEMKEFTILYNPELRVFDADIFGDINFVEFTVRGGVLDLVMEDALALSFGSMTMIDLRRNNIKATEDFPFNELPSYKKLTHLYLSENRFPSCPVIESNSITYLDLSQNPLTAIPGDAFSQLPKLEELFLRDIQLSSIEPGTFVGLENLHHLELSHNHLNVLSANSLATGSLQHLAVYLDFNAIQTIETDSFTNGDWIYMYGNQIDTLEENVWKPHLEAGGVLGIGGNPLLCDCSLAWLIRNPDLMNKHVDYLANCDDGRKLYDLTEDDFTNCP